MERVPHGNGDGRGSCHAHAAARVYWGSPSAPASGGSAERDRDREEFIQSQATAQLPVQSPLAAAPSWGGPQDIPTQYVTPTTPAIPAAPAAPAAPAGLGLPAGASDALDAMRVDEEAVRRQAANLRDTVEMLREAAQAMENERGQLQSFLDGSHDALERLEGWVGQQMNLDLRHSPEAVRAYLPLSVIWVTTTRLKKLIALLTSAGRNLTVTQEQMDETLAEFRSSLETLAQFTSFFAAERPSSRWWLYRDCGANHLGASCPQPGASGARTVRWAAR